MLLSLEGAARSQKMLSGTVCTAPEREHQTLSVFTVPEKFENAAVTRNIEFVLDGNSGWKITLTYYLGAIVFVKLHIQKCFPSTQKRNTKTQSRRFQIP